VLRRQRGFRQRQAVGPAAVGLGGIQDDAVAAHQTGDPAPHRGQQAAHLHRRRRPRCRHEAHRPIGRRGEDALRHQGVLCGVRDYAERGSGRGEIPSRGQLVGCVADPRQLRIIAVSFSGPRWARPISKEDGMVELRVRATGALIRFRSSPVWAYVDGFANVLHERGYSRTAAVSVIGDAVPLGRWADREGRSLAALDDGAVESFLAHLPGCHCPGRRGGQPVCTGAHARTFLDYLRGCGVVPPAALPSCGEPGLERLLRLDGAPSWRHAGDAGEFRSRSEGTGGSSGRGALALRRGRIAGGCA